jgi:hypothetical protein
MKSLVVNLKELGAKMNSLAVNRTLTLAVTAKSQL